MDKTMRQDQEFARLTDAVARYLESVGWRAVVMSNPRVQHALQPPGAPTHTFEFVVKFTGGRRPEARS